MRSISPVRLVAVLAVVAILGTLSIDAARWRANVIRMKLIGGVTEATWSELGRMLLPGSGYYLAEVSRGRTVYQAVRNPHAVDGSAGSELFQTECASCHGPTGAGAIGPSLTDRASAYGDSDWALYRTISHGVPGTAMVGRQLTDWQTWQLVAFVRSLTTTRPSVPDGSRDKSRSVSEVSVQRLLTASNDPANWLTYSGTYDSWHHSSLNQISVDNIGRLRLNWVYQFEAGNQPVEATPLVVDGRMYVTEPPSNVLALDAATGLLIWRYRRELPGQLRICCFRTNRGVAVLGRLVFIGTLDAHLIALHAETGRVAWDVEVAKATDGYTITSAPLAAGGKILIGVAGGEFGIRGFLDAYDAATGNRDWRFFTVPGPGEAGHDTWTEDSWQRGGGPTWLTGSFDPELNLVYWGVGNPGPPYRGDSRAGDNLYTNSVVALDLETGQLRWHFQFTPHDEHDWDANQVPVLVDLAVSGAARRVMLWANRNGFFYVLDRETGQFLIGLPFVKQTWAEKLDDNGRPVAFPESSPSQRGSIVWPGLGGTNWQSPSYSPITGLFYVNVLERPSVFLKESVLHSRKGDLVLGGGQQPGVGQAFVRALMPATGELAWEYRLGSDRDSHAGLLSTSSNLVFGGDGEGVFLALDALTGKELWRTNLGRPIRAAPIAFTNDGAQVIAVAAGASLFTFSVAK